LEIFGPEYSVLIVDFNFLYLPGSLMVNPVKSLKGIGECDPGNVSKMIRNK